MAETSEQIELLTKLKKPWKGEGVPPGWTESTDPDTDETVYTHTDGTVQRGTVPSTVSVQGIEDFLRAISYNEIDFREFVGVVLSSINEVTPVGSTDEEKDSYLKNLTDTVEEILAIVQSRRVEANRLSNLPSPRAATSSRGSLQSRLSREFSSNLFGSHTFIGPVTIDDEIEIQEVEVIENYDVASMTTLRSFTDPVVKTHKNDITLAITLTYPEHRLNDEVAETGFRKYGLRGLLATLRAAPICEISSTAILPVFLNNLLSPKRFQELREKAVSNATTPEEREIRQEEILQEVKSGDYSSDFTNLKEILGSYNPIVDYIATSPSKEEMESRVSSPDAPQKPSIVERSTAAISVPCAFRGAIIKTVSGKTNTVAVKLLFYRYADQAWQEGKILYRDSNGNKTADVFSCPWIPYMALKMFYKRNGPFGDVNHMKLHKPPLDGEEAFEFTWKDSITDDEVAYRPDPNAWMSQDIQARFTMKMAKLPLVGSPYPVCQYLGIGNVMAKISVTITEALELAKLHEMKAELDKINYDSGPSRKRKHFVTVKNGFLNLLGGYDFVISDIVTHVDNERNVWNVEMTLIESRISSEDVEGITLQDTAGKEIDDAKAVWDHIYDLLSERGIGQFSGDYRVLPSESNSHQYLIGPEEDTRASDELGTEGVTAYEIIFGEGYSARDLQSILHPNIILATWFSLTQKRKATSSGDSRSNTFVQWDTSFRNDPRVSAILEGRQFEGIGALVTNNRIDPDSTFSLSFVPTGDGGRTIKPIRITEDVDPISILETSTGFTGNRFDAVRAKLLNYFSKGQYDLADIDKELEKVIDDLDLSALQPISAELLEGAVSESARRNIYEQGNLFLWMLGTVHRKKWFFTKEFWDEYFRILMEGNLRPDLAPNPAWDNEDIQVARRNILSMVRFGFYDRFPSLRKKYDFRSVATTDKGVRVSRPEDHPAKHEKTASNYADMNLPTYESMFTLYGRPLTVRDGDATVPLWTRFAPTYSDLGKKPPFTRTLAYDTLDDAVSQIARGPNDPVEPSFMYYHKKLKEDAFSRLLQTRGNIERNLAEIRKNTIIIPASVARQDKQGRPGSAIGSWLREVYSDPSTRTDPTTFNRERDRVLLKEVGAIEPDAPEPKRGVDSGRRRSILLISEEGQPLGTVQRNVGGITPFKFNPFDKGESFRIFNGAGTDVIDPYDAPTIQKTHVDLSTRIPDRSLNMIKAFPAYRLYFIEEDGPRKWLADDLYGTNAVLDLNLRTDKWDSAILTCRISNTTHNLSEEEILTDSARERLGLLEDDEGEPFFSKLKLQSGVKVQLRMGYGSLHEDLPIVFTGMITEVLPGKVVEFVAQGHKRELLNEVQFANDGVNHFTVIDNCLKKTEHPNLGDKVEADEVGTAMAGFIAPPYMRAEEKVGIFDRIFNTQYTNVMRNVHINSQAPGESFRGVVNLGSPELTAAATAIKTYYHYFTLPEWVVPPQSCWEAIQEVCRHRPGHIAQVVPFETRGTLFVGQPEQPYFAGPVPHNESLAYRKLEPLLAVSNRIELHDEVLVPFMEDSTWLRVYRAHGKDLSPGEAHYDPQSRLTLGIGNTTLFPEDIFELDEIPDGNRQRVVLDYWKETPLKHSASIRLLSRQIPNLPTTFTLTDWYVHPNDMTNVVEYIDEISPSLFEELFYWYFDINPTAGRLAFGTSMDEIRLLFTSVDSKIFLRSRENVLRDNSNFAVPYRNVQTGLAELNLLPEGVSSVEDELDILRERGVISEERRDQLLSYQDISLVPRARAADPAYGILKDSLEENIKVGELVHRAGGGFRLFLYYLWRHFNTRSFSDNPVNKGRVDSSTERLRLFDLPPGYQVFRSYHLIGPKDIIENNIYASMAEMSNSVLVRAPASEVAYTPQDSEFEDESNEEDAVDILLEHDEMDWRSYPTTDGVSFNSKIGRENRKLGVVYELNATEDDQRARTLMTNMGLMLQPMYRGSLTVIGREIKPYDVVYLDDPENELRGHFEVASVVHHFSPDTGWVSVIEPHALVRVNNPTSELQISGMNQFLRDMSGFIDVLDWGLIAASVLGLVFTGGAGLASGFAARRGVLSLGSKAAKSAAKNAAKKAVATGMRSWALRTGAAATNVYGRLPGTIRTPISILGKIGRSAITVRGVFALGSVVGTYHLADMITSLAVKHQVASMELPVDLHLLLYRGQYLQAGLEIGQEDVYSIYEKFAGVGTDLVEGFEEGITELIDDITGTSNRNNPIEDALRDD